MRVVTDDAEGWGEVGAEIAPTYAPDTLDTARLVLRDELVPRLFAGAALDDGARATTRRGPRSPTRCSTRGCAPRALRSPSHLGGDARRTSTPASRSDAPTSTGRRVARRGAAYVALGLPEPEAEDRARPRRRRRSPRCAPRSAPTSTLQVDANGSYTLADADRLAALDAFDVACLEQPLAPDALLDHARLARAAAHADRSRRDDHERRRRTRRDRAARVRGREHQDRARRRARRGARDARRVRRGRRRGARGRDARDRRRARRARRARVAARLHGHRRPVGVEPLLRRRPHRAVRARRRAPRGADRARPRRHARSPTCSRALHDRPRTIGSPERRDRLSSATVGRLGDAGGSGAVGGLGGVSRSHGPHHHDRVLGMVGIEPQHDRVRERRVARVVLHDRDLFLLRRFERVAQPEQPGREHRTDRGVAELVDRPRRVRRAEPVDRRAAPTRRRARPRSPPPRRARPSRAATGSRSTVQPSGSTGTSRSGTVMPAPIALRYASFAVHCSRNARSCSVAGQVEPVGVRPPASSTRAASASSRARGRSTSMSTPTRAPVTTATTANDSECDRLN